MLTATSNCRAVNPAAAEHLGETGMTVVGTVSGKRYRFNHPRAVVEIDARDRPSLAAVPKLRQRRG